MKRLISAAALAAALALAPAIAMADSGSPQTAAGQSAAYAVPVQGVTGGVPFSVSGFTPTPAYASLSVGASSTRVALPTGTVVVVYNIGTNTAYVTLGNSSVVATAANDAVPAGGACAFTVGSNVDLAGIESGGTTTLTLSGGSGLVSGCWGGGSAGSNASVGATGSAVPGSATLGGMSVGGTMTAVPGTANGLKTDGSAVTQPAALNATPSLANGNGVVPTQGGSVLSVTNPSFAEITDGTNGAATIKAASTSSVATDKSLVVQINPQQTPAINNAQVGGNATSTGAGATGTGTQRVGVAQDTTTVAGAAPTTTGIYVTGPSAAALATSANQPTAAAQGSTTAGQTGPLAQGAVTTSAPSDTNGQTSPLSLNLSGGLRVDGSAVTQPVSAASLPLPTGAATLALQTTGNSTLSTINSTLGSPMQSSGGTVAVTQSTASALNATARMQDGSGNALTSSGGALNVSGSFSASISGFTPNGVYSTPLSVGASSTRVALPTGTAIRVFNVGANGAYVLIGNSSVVATTSNDYIPPGCWSGYTVGANVDLAAIETAGATTINISGGAGLADAGCGTAPWAATAANQPTNATSGSATSGQTGNLAMGATSTSSPAETSGQTNNLSLTLAGALRVDGSAVTQPTSIGSGAMAAGASADIGNCSLSSPWTGSGTGNVCSYLMGIYAQIANSVGAAVNLGASADSTGVAGANTLTAADSVSTSASTNQNGQTAWTGLPTANSAVVFNVTGWTQATFTITGTFSATANSECTGDSVSKQAAGTAQWVACSMLVPGSSSSNFSTASAFTAPVENALISTVGLTAVRLRVPSAGYTSGTITVTANETNNQRLAHITGASYASQPGNLAPKDAIYAGARAENAEPTPTSNGQLTGLATGLEGKLIVLPFANKENMLRGTASQTGTSATTLIAAQGSGVHIYVTGVQCKNTGSTTTIVTLDDNETTGGGTVLIVPAAGGDNEVYQTPLVVASNTALTFTPTASESTIYCNAQGYSGS